MRNGVADAHFLRGLDARDDIPHVAGAHLIARRHFELQDAHLVGIVFFPGGDKLHAVALADDPVLDFEISDDSPEGVEHRVEDKALERRLRVARRRRHLLDDGVQDVVDPLARLPARPEDVLAVAAQQLDNLVFHLVGHGARQVDFVQHRDNFQVVVDSHIEIRDGLSLNALRRIDDEQRALAGGNRARHLVREIHVPRRIDQIQRVFFPFIRILHLDSVALDGDASFAFQIHIVQHLVLHIAALDRLRVLQKAVGQRTLAVVDMGNDTKVSDILHI